MRTSKKKPTLGTSRPSQKPAKPTKTAELDRIVKGPSANSSRLTTDVPAELHRRLKIACASEGRTMSDYIRELLERGLKSSGY